MLRKKGRSCASQFMSRRCNKQVCTHDRAGRNALRGSDRDQVTVHALSQQDFLHLLINGNKSKFTKSRRVRGKRSLLIEAAEALYRLHKHEHQLMVGAPHFLSQLLTTV